MTRFAYRVAEKDITVSKDSITTDTRMRKRIVRSKVVGKVEISVKSILKNVNLRLFSIPIMINSPIKYIEIYENFRLFLHNLFTKSHGD